jgi:hypothetical protein
MHSLPADSQHPPDFGVGFVQVPADDFEPLTGRGMLPLGVRVGLHRTAIINAFFAGNSSIIPSGAGVAATRQSATD